MKLSVNEIFYSIQGEGLDSGRLCAMIRLSGCNLRCRHCDTQYAFYEGSDLEIDEITEQIKGYNTDLAEVTGGEPLIQKNTLFLVKKLLDLGYKTLIETNGSCDIGFLDERCIKIMDIKTPSSGMEKFNLYSNLSKLKNEDQVKFVIKNRDDFDFATNLLKNYSLNIKSGNILFSPAADELEFEKLADWIIKTNTHVRMQVQLHKIIWPDNKRGV
ncbi:MAG: radical SAM protein [Thermodesulfobacteriota bacterium]